MNRSKWVRDEQDFHGFSYGFRPGRSPHNALDAIWVGITQRKVNFAVPGNKRAIDAFRTEVIKAWLFALRRRSQKSMDLRCERIKRLVVKWIPSAKVQHPYPNERLYVNNPR